VLPVCADYAGSHIQGVITQNPGGTQNTSLACSYAFEKTASRLPASFKAGAINPPGMPFFHMHGAEYMYFNTLSHFK
jgi:hypothetical protein